MKNKRILLGLLVVGIGNVFAAEGDTFTPYYTSALVYDSNLLRIDDDNTSMVSGVNGRSDTLKKNVLGVDVDWHYSRQEFLITAVMSDNDFQRFNTLDYQGRYLKTQWNWQLGNYFKGNIGQVYNRSLASFNDIRGISGNLRDQQSRFFNLNWLFHPSWQAGVSFSENDLEYDNSMQRIGDFENSIVGVNLDYLTSKGSKLGFKLSQEDGRYPNRSVTEISTLDNAYTQDTAAVIVDWRYSVKTSVKLQGGYVERRYDNLPQRDYDAFDKRLSITYSPTVKTKLMFSLFEETSPRDDLQASVSENLGQSLELSWLPTSKLTVIANYKREKRRDIGDPGFIVGPSFQRIENNDNFSFSLNYAPHRNVDLTAGYNEVERDSTEPLGDFDAEIFSLTATIKM